MKLKTTVLAAVAAMVLAQPALAAVTFSGSGTAGDGHALSASATFDIAGSKLKITLTNTDSFTGGFKNAWGLTGIFWDLATAQSLTATGSSATIASGAILNPEYCDQAGSNCATQTNVGGEFRYQKSPYTTGAPTGIGSYGIASSGYIGGNGNMNGLNLDDPNAVDGRNFSILGSNATGLTPSAPAGDPSIKSTVTFLLPTLSAGFLLTSISNVSFQYGTAWTQTNFGGSCTGTDCGGGGGGSVPEPGSLALVGLALLGVGVARKRLR